MENRKFRIKLEDAREATQGTGLVIDHLDNKVTVVETDETGGRITYRCKSMEEATELIKMRDPSLRDEDIQQMYC